MCLDMSTEKSMKYLHLQTYTTKYIEWKGNIAIQHTQETSDFVSPKFGFPVKHYVSIEAAVSNS